MLLCGLLMLLVGCDFQRRGISKTKVVENRLESLFVDLVINQGQNLNRDVLSLVKLSSLIEQSIQRGDEPFEFLYISENLDRWESAINDLKNNEDELRGEVAIVEVFLNEDVYQIRAIDYSGMIISNEDIFWFETLREIERFQLLETQMIARRPRD
jgi:hypothetical protein